MRPALRRTSCLAFSCSSACETYAETAMPAANTSASTILNLSRNPMGAPLTMLPYAEYYPLGFNAGPRPPDEPRHLAATRLPGRPGEGGGLFRRAPVGDVCPARAPGGERRGGAAGRRPPRARRPGGDLHGQRARIPARALRRLVGGPRRRAGEREAAPARGRLHRGPQRRAP